MALKKQEAVTVSFHYLTRHTDPDEGDPVEMPFGQPSFDGLMASLKAKPALDLSNQAQADKLRLRLDAPITHLEQVNARTVFGTYQGSYWGHAYENTAKGRIPADSISLRPFHFLLYLSESGRIYIASQYLGLFGGYSALQKTICSLLGTSHNISSHSFHAGGSAYKDASAKEVHVTYSNKSKSISADNKIGDAGILVFRKSSKDDGFEKEVSDRLFPIMGKGPAAMKKAVADLTSENKLFAVRDSDIEDCKVIAFVNGRKKTIHMLEESNFATRFSISTSLDSDGHPLAETTKSEMIKLLKEEILSKVSVG